MTREQHDRRETRLSRRTFLRTATTAAAGAAVAVRRDLIPGLYAAGSDEIRVGLIGCGGRGTGAAMNVLAAAEGVKLIALADVFEDRLERSRAVLTEKAPASKMDVKDDHVFVGLDAYQKLLATDVNYVILATPPGFRPLHIAAAVAAGKYVFAEKPVCVDVAGAKANLESVAEIDKKGLGLVAGTQYRHFVPYVEALTRIQDGAIGKLVAGRCYYNTGELWSYPRESQWTDLEYQLRNWYYYTYLSGDHLVEQAVHNVDAMVWAFGTPVAAVALGGRQVRTDPLFGHIYDHFAVDYEFGDGAHCMLMCRQQDGTDKKVANEFVGTRGTAFVLPNYYITGEQPWKLEDSVSTDLGNAYVQEHADFINSIRAGKPLNELQQVTESSVAAILGREAAYTGQALTWTELMASTQSLMPASLEWGSMPVPSVPMPGQTELQSSALIGKP
ncbi:MAG: gfo/Idh/MocA family oxidoreductase [Luteitalea sp.]|nr:gfo/Idh/MocA family oxidoreductase [Luteitalea sp.]